MTSLFDKLNLTPQERRLVVFVGLFLFVVINLWLVWPHFGDLGMWQQRQRDKNAELRRYQIEIQKEPTYRREREKLQKAGQVVSDEAKARELLRTVQRQAIASNVRLQNATPGRGGGSSQTNAFFDEESVLVSFESGQKELIDFLYNLGAHGSLIRVRTMTVGPEQPNRYKLTGSITLVESFARRSPTAAASSTAAPKPTSAPTTSPAAASAPATAQPSSAAPPNVAAQPAVSPPATLNPAASRPKTKTSQPAVKPMPIQPTNSVVIPRRRILTPPAPGKSP